MKHIDHRSWGEELQDPRGGGVVYLPTLDDTLAPSAPRTDTLRVVPGLTSPTVLLSAGKIKK